LPGRVLDAPDLVVRNPSPPFIDEGLIVTIAQTSLDAAAVGHITAGKAVLVFQGLEPFAEL